MAQNDVNIKIKVDTSQANNSTENYKRKLKELKDEMTALQVETDGLSNATADQRKRFAELEAEAGKIADAMGDAQQRIKNLSDDYAGMTAALEGVGAAVGGITAVSGAMELLGGDSEAAQESIKKVTSLMAILQGVQSVQKALNKDSAAMAALRNIKEKLLTTTIQQQTTAQLALNAAKLGAIGAITALVAAVGVLIYKYASAKSEVAKFNEELNKQASESVAPLVVSINDLASEWESLGDSLEAKEKFIKDNKDAFKDLGVEVTNVNEAESLLVANKDKFIEAQILKAKATAARAKMEETAKEALEDELEYERIFVDKQTTIWEDLALAHPLINDEKMQAAHEREQKRLDDQTKKLQDLIKGYEAEAAAILQEIGVTETSTEKTENKTTAQDALNKSLEKTASLIRLKYAQAIADATTAAEKLILKKSQEAELLNDEIKQREILSGKLAKNSEEWAKNEIKLIELRKAREDLYKVEVAQESLEDELVQINFKQIDASQRTADILGSELVPATELYANALKELDKQGEDNLNNLQERSEKELAIISQKWTAAQNLATAYGDAVTAQMEAELAEVEGNEVEQTRIRKKYARSRFLGQIASIGISTAQAIMATWAEFAGMPIYAGIQSAMLTTTGIAQALKARAEMDNALKAARGGILYGPSHAQGGIMLSNGVEAEGGEAIINKRSTAAFAPILSAINSYNGYGAPLIPGGNAGGLGATTDDAIRRIVAATVEGITSIPVVVSEHSITEAQRTVHLTKERSFI